MTWTFETDAPASILLDRMRVCALGATGAPLVGVSSLYVTDAVVKIMWSQEVESGLDLTLKNGQGNLCVRRRTPDVVKWLKVTVDICAPDPELEWLLTGGTVLKATNATIGLQDPALGVDPVPYGVSIEGWSETDENGQAAGTNAFFQFVFPKVKLENKGDRTLEAGILANSFSGYGYENANWGDGPATGNWAYDSTKVVQRARVASGTVPAAAVGLQAVA